MIKLWLAICFKIQQKYSFNFNKRIHIQQIYSFNFNKRIHIQQIYSLNFNKRIHIQQIYSFNFNKRIHIQQIYSFNFNKRIHNQQICVHCRLTNRVIKMAEDQNSTLSLQLESALKIWMLCWWYVSLREIQYLKMLLKLSSTTWKRV